MGASESAARTNGTKEEEEEEERQRASGGSSTAAGAAMAVAAVGVAAWGISRMLSNNTEDQENEGAMKMQGTILQHQAYLPISSINNNHGSGYEGMRGSNPTPNTWSPPPLSRFKMNTDGSCRPNEGFHVMQGQGQGQRQGPSGYAGVLRDHCGKWVQGFYGFMGVSDCLTAEFYGIYYGLLILDKLGKKEATLESDSEAAVDWIKRENNSNCNSRPIINNCWEKITECKRLILKNKITVTHCSRNSNKLADKLADMAIQEQNVNMDISYETLPDGEIKRIADQESRMKPFR